jgi:hypothetical protein
VQIFQQVQKFPGMLQVVQVRTQARSHVIQVTEHLLRQQSLVSTWEVAQKRGGRKDVTAVL